jgi:hypothetical protein
MSIFSPTDYSKIALALSKMKERLAHQLKQDLIENSPNENQARIFMELYHVAELEHHCLCLAKEVGNSLLGSLTVRATLRADPSIPRDITNVGDVPDMPTERKG